MKCVNCGEQTGGETIVCANCRSVDRCAPYLEQAHACKSFTQTAGGEAGLCDNGLRCQPIRMALKGQCLVDSTGGHIICLEAKTNLARIVYARFKPGEIESLRSNYGECFE